MKKRFRLKGRRDFQRVVTTRRIVSTANLVGFAQPGRSDHSRLGVGASRRISGSVQRNRARRRLREAVRLSLRPDGSLSGAPGIKLDVVLIARPALLRVEFPELLADLAALAGRLRGIAGPG